MTTSFRLHSLEQAVTIGTTLSHSWFRGHVGVYGELTPRVWRDPLKRRFLPDLEFRRIDAFKRDAPAIAREPLPADDDALGWLSLMQHYEAPTRLLDWTESVLVALFFAIGRDRADWERDGELWAMLPWVLNGQAGIGKGLPLPGRSVALAYLSEEPFWNDQNALVQDILARGPFRGSVRWREDPKPFVRPIAFEPRRNFTRMSVQSSVVTIHPEPSDGNTIPQILTDATHLVRYIVPAGVKSKMWGDLRYLGMTDRTLFPDFEGLSRTIDPPQEAVGYVPPEPPECCGPYESASEIAESR